MGAVLGLGVGVGLVLVGLALTSPASYVEKPDRVGRLRDLLDRAGLSGTTVAGVWTVCAISAGVAFVAIQVVSRTATVALAFGLMAGYLPVAMLAGRARRRQRELAEVWPEAVDNLASAVRAGLSLPRRSPSSATGGPSRCESRSSRSAPTTR